MRDGRFVTLRLFLPLQIHVAVAPLSYFCTKKVLWWKGMALQHMRQPESVTAYIIARSNYSSIQHSNSLVLIRIRSCNADVISFTQTIFICENCNSLPANFLFACLYFFGALKHSEYICAKNAVRLRYTLPFFAIWFPVRELKSFCRLIAHAHSCCVDHHRLIGIGTHIASIDFVIRCGMGTCHIFTITTCVDTWNERFFSSLSFCIK